MVRKLLIKGNPFQAARAAADRGIALVFERETLDHQCSLGMTRDSAAKLNEWFIEPRDLSPRDGYPPGTLLFWYEVDDTPF